MKQQNSRITEIIRYSKPRNFLFTISLRKHIIFNIQIWRTEHMKRKVLLITVGIFLATAIAGCKKGG